jgi:hypothetical protein
MDDSGERIKSSWSSVLEKWEWGRKAGEGEYYLLQESNIFQLKFKTVEEIFLKM